MAQSKYQPGTTALKGGKEGAYAIGSGGIVALVLNALRAKDWLPWGPELDIEAAAVFTGALAGLVKAARNFMRERGLTDLLPHLVLGFLVLPLAAGCASTAKTIYNEESWEMGQDGQMHEVKVRITAKTKAGLFGEVPEGVHDVAATWSKNKDTVNLGQRASIDNTKQADVAEAVATMAVPFISAAFKGLAGAIGAASPAPVPGLP